MVGAMPRAALVFAASFVAVTAARGQEGEFFQAPKKGGLEVEAMLRNEWTKEVFDTPTETHNLDRWRVRVMPRITAGGNRFNVVVGGDFNYSKDDNIDPLENGMKPAILRDNYQSRGVRLDLATANLQPTNWLKVEGGRFVMPVAFTEMIWDRDLRPQGGAVRLSTGQVGDIESLHGAFVFTEGGHVFDDGKTRILIGSAGARLKAGMNNHLEITGSMLEFKNLNELEGMIRRQNTRTLDTDRFLLHPFRVVDVVGRVQAGGNVPLQMIANMAWNTRISENNRGLWLALVLGSIRVSRARLEYTYANVDKDATVAAFAADDFFWGTGWEGHRVELGTRSGSRFTAHLIGQLQRFKDSPIEEERDHWVKRFRIEMRLVP